MHPTLKAIKPLDELRDPDGRAVLESELQFSGCERDGKGERGVQGVPDGEGEGGEGECRCVRLAGEEGDEAGGLFEVEAGADWSSDAMRCTLSNGC